ncbi:MAG TPA: hypothetical protein VF588_10805 [Pyrinomonadaceae bacterium]
MPEIKHKNLTLRCLTLTLLVLGLFSLTKDSTRASLSLPQARPKLPTTSVAPQPDAPLRITHTFAESEPGMVRLKVMAQNQSGKQIRACAIVADAGSHSQVDFVNLTTSAAALRPTQIKTFDIAYGENEAPDTVTLSVDFVEFDDGSTWGADTHNSRDMLAGQREGAKAERSRLRELLKSGGVPAVFDAVREEVPDVMEIKSPTKHSGAWVTGYRHGVGGIRHRLRQNLQSSDPVRAESELARPFDLSEERP